jgi:hypothetical protein
MHEKIEELSSVRTIVVRYPDGRTQFWLTEETFAEGKELRRNGQTWIVQSVLQPEQSNGSATVTLRDAD